MLAIVSCPRRKNFNFTPGYIYLFLFYLELHNFCYFTKFFHSDILTQKVYILSLTDIGMLTNITEVERMMKKIEILLVEDNADDAELTLLAFEKGDIIKKKSNTRCKGRR